mmetsp:Transcript_11905/g.27642  ORF Transcript_11905/g.27642 Transcript_11905/m.27642 type:complete len:455 (-) Transcript_11905:2568-3932(-)
MRDFKTRNSKTAKSAKEHRTGRICKACGGDMHDTIINFGESLPDRDLSMANDQAGQADLCLALGSSLSVSPANHIPEQVGCKQGGRLVIVNLMRTPLDGHADLVIHAKCDTVMELLMEELAIDIPTFKLQRKFEIGATSLRPALQPAAEGEDEGEADAKGANSLRIWVRGLSPCASGSGDDVPFQFIRRLVVLEAGSGVGVGATGRTSSAKGVLGGWTAVSGTKHTQPKRKGGVPRPYSEVLKDALGDDNFANVEVTLAHPNTDTSAIPVRVKLHFFGNYNEPPLELVVNAGTVSQYDISLEPTKPPLSAVDSLGSTNATGDASGKAADEASGTSQAGNTTSMANSEGPVRNTWVHERVVDVTSVANPKHKTTEAELLTELKSPTGVVDDADTATKAAEEPAAELGTQPSVARKKSGRVRRPVGRAAECSTGEAGRGGQEEGGCTVTVSAVPAR